MNTPEYIDSTTIIRNFAAKLAAVIFTLLIACLGTSMAQTNLIRNGSFEIGSDPGSFAILEAGSTAIQGWTVSRATVDYIGSYFPSAHGRRHIDLDGTPGFGAIKQVFATTSGQTYRVTFALAGNPQGAPQIKKMGIRAAGQSATFTHEASLNWANKVWTFTAVGPSTTLEFYSLDAEGEKYGPLLDNISVAAVAAVSAVTPSGKTYVDSRGRKVYFPLGERSFADGVVSYQMGNPAPVEKYRAPQVALGPPDYISESEQYPTSVTLGCGGSLTLRFTRKALIDVPGPDLYVFEVGPAVEPTKLSISQDGAGWITVGNISGGTAAIDIAPFVRPGAQFHYIRLTDLQSDCGGSWPGADIDAVGLIGVKETSEPSIPVAAPPDDCAQIGDLFNSFNIAGTANGPGKATVFTLNAPARITELVTYHWNFGRGSRPGSIGLRNQNGQSFGPFAATGTSGQDGAVNVNWVAQVKLTLPAGTYTIVDSDPITWSTNVQSGFQGFAIVRGNRQCGTAADAPEDQPFGSTTPLASALRGDIYFLESDTSRLPDFKQLRPVGTVYATELNITPRGFSTGFPGVTNRFEWFGIVYNGAFLIDRAGPYQFRVTSDDGAKVFIDGRLVVDNDGLHAPATRVGSVVLQPGRHHIQVQYYQGPRTYIALVLEMAKEGEPYKIFRCNTTGFAQAAPLLSE
jgi:choice-of-anchor C domain-containing protein